VTSAKRAIPENDPLWQAVIKAPMYDGPVPEQERLDVEAALMDDRTPEEKAAGRAKIRAWLDNLPPPLAKMYQDLKRLDPKGQPR
jgi:hypothetical protein